MATPAPGIDILAVSENLSQAASGYRGNNRVSFGFAVPMSKRRKQENWANRVETARIGNLANMFEEHVYEKEARDVRKMVPSLKRESVELPDGQVITPDTEPEVIELALWKYSGANQGIYQSDIDKLLTWFMGTA